MCWLSYVLEFLGANYLEDKPFIVMPYLKNGNARDYVGRNPQCNRLRIVCVVVAFWVYIPKNFMQVRHAALGLLHLHTHRVVHGDIKAVRVCIMINWVGFQWEVPRSLIFLSTTQETRFCVILVSPVSKQTCRAIWRTIWIKWKLSVAVIGWRQNDYVEERSENPVIYTRLGWRYTRWVSFIMFYNPEIDAIIFWDFCRRSSSSSFRLWRSIWPRRQARR